MKPLRHWVLHNINFKSWRWRGSNDYLFFIPTSLKIYILVLKLNGISRQLSGSDYWGNKVSCQRVSADKLGVIDNFHESMINIDKAKLENFALEAWRLKPERHYLQFKNHPQAALWAVCFQKLHDMRMLQHVTYCCLSLQICKMNEKKYSWMGAVEIQMRYFPMLNMHHQTEARISIDKNTYISKYHQHISEA